MYNPFLTYFSYKRDKSREQDTYDRTIYVHKTTTSRTTLLPDQPRVNASCMELVVEEQARTANERLGDVAHIQRQDAVILE